MKKTIYIELSITDYITPDTHIGGIMELVNIFQILKKEKKKLIDYHLKMMNDEWQPHKKHVDANSKHIELKRELEIINKNLAMLETARIIKENDAFDYIDTGEYCKN